VNASSTQWIFASLLACTLAVGCSQNKKKDASMALQPSSLDVPAAAPVATTAPPVQYTPPQPAIADPAPTQQPVIESTADVSDTSAPVVSSKSARKASYASRSGTKYTVKKGESLWSIAQSHYGNGNKWKTIAAANPQINPNKIQAGQTITLP
jgi:5'-nucleotidase